MTNLIVMSFENEARAIEASHKLLDLDSFGDISIFEKAMVKKDANGHTSLLQSDTTDGLRTISGMTLGTIVGALGGPVGMFVGLLTGTLTGAILDSVHIDFDENFVSRVTDRLKPHTVAIIAEISEDDPSLLDSTFERYGATVIRSNVDYVHDEYNDDQVEEFDKQITEERARVKSAVNSEKVKIQEKIASLKEKRRQRIASLKQKHQAGIAKFRLKVKEYREARIQKKIHHHQQRIDELQEKLKGLEEE